MDDDSIKKIEELFKHHMGIFVENVNHKLDLVIEGQQMLSEKVDRLETRVDRVEVKVDAVAVDLAAHRLDTEAHHGVYRVKES